MSTCASRTDEKAEVFRIPNEKKKKINDQPFPCETFACPVCGQQCNCKGYLLEHKGKGRNMMKMEQNRFESTQHNVARKISDKIARSHQWVIAISLFLALLLSNSSQKRQVSCHNMSKTRDKRGLIKEVYCIKLALEIWIYDNRLFIFHILSNRPVAERAWKIRDGGRYFELYITLHNHYLYRQH